MPSIINMPKSFEDVAQPEPLPDDWYTLRIVKDPEVTPNAVLKQYMKDTGVKAPEEALRRALETNYVEDDNKRPGFNWVVFLKTVSDIVEFSGRSFRKYLPLPNDGDRDRYTANGQSFEDWKMENIRETVAAFHGSEPSGDEVSLENGMVAQFYITTRYNDKRKKMENELDMNTAPVPA